MSDERPLRGPDFLPYLLPEPPAAAAAPEPPPALPTRRWEAALDGVPPWGVAAVTGGVAGLLSLLVVSLLADRRGAGATLAVLAAVVAVVAGRRALRPPPPGDSRTVVRVGQGTAVASAVVAVLLALSAPGSTQAQQPVQPPSPAPAASAPAPSPSAPLAPLAPLAPGPSATPFTAPPGAVNGFGRPSQPGPPLSTDPRATGTLYGHVVTTGGAPVPAATVEVTRALPGDTSDTPACPTRVTTKTDAQGVYRLQLCQLGDQLGYTVTITSGGARAQADAFINAGQTTVYDVILPVRRA